MKLLTDEHIVALHARVLAELGGGAPGIRERQVIQSAIGRMSSGFGEREFYPGIFEKVAVLLESLIQSHPFVDGNKRTAVVAAGALLEANGWQLSYNSDEVVEFALAVANHQIDLPDIIAWLKEHSTEAS